MGDDNGYTIADAAPADGWPDPDMGVMASDAHPPPPLPLAGTFGPAWAGWIEAAAEAKGAPPDFVALAVVAAAGSLTGNARWANPWEGWAEPPIINAALVGNPSSGKSPALDAVIDPIDAIQAGADEDWDARRREHAAAAKVAKLHCERWEAECKEAVKTGNSPPPMPAAADVPPPIAHRRIYSTNPTVEMAARLSAPNPRGLLLYVDELAGWLASMGRYNGDAGGDRAFWLQAYGGRPWTPDRVKDGDDGVSVPHLTWGVLGGIQPDRLASLLLAGDDDGLAARFIVTWPAPRPPIRPRDGLQTALAGAWLARLRALPWTPPAPILVPFSPEARALVQEWREEVAGGEAAAAGLFLSWLGKLPGFAIRLALILAHLDWAADGRGDPPNEVAHEHVARAIVFLSDYAVPMARRCYGEATLPEEERDAKRLARWLRARPALPETVNARLLRRDREGPAIATAERMTAALRVLEAFGWVRPAPAGGAAGRPRGDWLVNPKVREKQR